MRKKNYKIILFDCVWHRHWHGFMLTPALRFDNLGKDGWTFDIIWLKLYITFGYVLQGK